MILIFDYNFRATIMWIYNHGGSRFIFGWYSLFDSTTITKRKVRYATGSQYIHTDEACYAQSIYLARNKIEEVMTWMEMLRVDMKAPHLKHIELRVGLFAFIRITRSKKLQWPHCTHIHTQVLTGSYVYAKSVNWLWTFHVILHVIVLIPPIRVSEFFFSKTIYFRMTYDIDSNAAFAYENKSKFD